MQIQLRANAKINLGLRVQSKRTDGYHGLQTVFMPLYALYDEIVVEIIGGAEGIELVVEGEIDTGPVEQNLLVRAYELLRVYAPPPVRVRLAKRIPTGAGLGGGSSDASCFLSALAPCCATPPSQRALFDMALQLGSDCPFFLYNRPAFATGRGEELRPAHPDCRGFYVLVVSPPIHVSTAWAFSQVTPTDTAVALEEWITRPVSNWQQGVVNDFYDPIARHYPVISEHLASLKVLGATFTALSGSGPSVYGLFSAAPVGYETQFSGCRIHLERLDW